ncbi:MAG: ATP-binding protein [Gemmatimonadaceae bacterium]
MTIAPGGVVSMRETVLAQAALALAGAATFDEAFDRVAEVLMDDLGAIGCAVFTASGDDGSVIVTHQRGAGSAPERRITHKVTAKRLALVMRTGAAIYHGDVGAVPDMQDEHHVSIFGAQGIHAVCLLPLATEGPTFGALSVRYQTVQRFDAGQQQLLIDLASHLAMAWRHLTERETLARRSDRLAALTRAQFHLSRITQASDFRAAVVRAVHEVIPHQWCDVLTGTPEALVRLTLGSDGHPVPFGPPTPDELTVAQASARSGIARMAVHLHDTPTTSRGTVELSVVARSGRGPLLVLRVLAARSDAFEPEDLELLTLLVRQAATVLETTRLFRVQRTQRRRAEGSAALARVMLEERGLVDGARALLAVLDRAIPSSGKVLALRTATGLGIEAVATTGSLASPTLPPFAIEHAIMRLAGHGQPRQVASLREASPAEGPTQLPDEWATIVPVTARGRLVAMLVISTPRGAPLLGREQATLTRLTSPLALAVDALLRQREEQLSHEREHLLASAIMTIEFPIFILDATRIRFANGAAAREYGWSGVELAQMTFEELIATESGATLASAESDDASLRAHALAGTKILHQQHRRRDGTDFPVAITVSVLPATSSGPSGYVVSTRNIATDRQLEEQLRQTEKLIALGELVSGVAHEINNPLTGISAFAQLMLEDPLDADQQQSVQLIKQEADRASAVIKDLMLFARRSTPTVGPVQLNDLLAQTLRLRAYSLRNAGVQVVLHTDPALPTVAGDPQKLQQVFVNLIGNAEDAMAGAPTRTLTIHTAVVHGLVQVQVTDTGRGIPVHVRPRIFEPFFTTKPAGMGTGLGLSASYGIIQAHGGDIEVSSEEGAGTTMTVTLPFVGLSAVP